MAVQFVATAHGQRAPRVASPARQARRRDVGRAGGARSSPPAACPSTRRRRPPRRRRAAPSATPRCRRCRWVTLTPSVAEHALQRAGRELLDDDALPGADDDVAHHLARQVPEQAVEHVRARELGGAPVQREDVGDHLPLHLPDEDTGRAARSACPTGPAAARAIPTAAPPCAPHRARCVSAAESGSATAWSADGGTCGEHALDHAGNLAHALALGDRYRQLRFRHARGLLAVGAPAACRAIVLPPGPLPRLPQPPEPFARAASRPGLGSMIAEERHGVQPRRCPAPSRSGRTARIDERAR